MLLNVIWSVSVLELVRLRHFMACRALDIKTCFFSLRDSKRYIKVKDKHF